MLSRAARAGLIPGTAVAFVLFAAFLLPAAPAKVNLWLAGTCYGYGCGVPVVTSVNPSSGPTAGGTTVTITGRYFSGALGVAFNGTEAASFTVNSDTSITATSPAHSAGTVDVRVSTYTGTSAVTSADKFSYGPCTSVSLAPDKASPQTSGTIITFTATAGGCTDPESKFWLRPVGGAWSLVQNYDGNSWIWNTAGKAAGNYQVTVWTREFGSPQAFQTSDSVSYTLTPAPPCTGGGLTSNKASPQQSGTIILFKGSATGCSNPEFKFWTQAPGHGYVLRQNYGGPNFVWNTAGLAPGVYKVNVWVRQQGSGVSYQTFAIVNFTLTGAVACSGTTLGSDKSSPQARGTTITFTANTTGCSQPQFKFWLKRPNGTWVLVQNYDGNTFVWKTTAGAAAGTYVIDVWVRQNGASASYQDFKTVNFTLT